MTAQSTNITHMAAQLRSLSLEQEPVAARVDEGAEKGQRRAVWPRTIAVLIGIGATGYGASLTQPGHAALDFARLKAETLLTPYFGVAATGAAELPEAAPQMVTQADPTAAPAPAIPAPRQLLGSGYSRAGRDVVLGAPLPARITSVEVTEGAVVKAGAVLVRLDDRSAQDAVARAELTLREAQLAAAKAALTVTQSVKDRVRAEALAARKVGPQRAADDAGHALDMARMEAEIATLAVTSAETALAAARTDLADYAVRAPFGGVVADLTAAPGMITYGDQSDVLLRLFDPASLMVDVDIAERSLGDLATGITAEVGFDAWPEQSFHGRVTEIAPILSKERGTIRVTVVLDAPPPDLRPNMAARTTLLLEEGPQKATGPLSLTSHPKRKGDDDV